MNRGRLSDGVTNIAEPLKEAIERQAELGLEFPRARRTDPATSHAAADRASELVDRHFESVLKALEGRPGTIYGIGKAAGIDAVAVARRLPELQKLGKARPTERTELSPSGRACRVWEKV